MRSHVVAAVADPLAEHEGADEARDAGIDVDDGAAGEIEHAERAEEAAAPHPMGDRGVDEDAPQPHEPHHRRELHAVGETAAGSAGVMMAKVIWNIMNTESGMVPEAASTLMPWRKKRSSRRYKR